MCQAGWYLVVSLLCGFGVGDGRQKLKIFPKTVLTNPHDNRNVSCVLKMTVDKCEFRLRYQNANETKTEDSPVFTAASDQSPVRTQVNSSVGQKLYAVEFWNPTTTECQIWLSDLCEGRYLVGCRAKSTDRSWAEEYMTINVSTQFERGAIETNNSYYDMIQVVKHRNTSAAINLELTSDRTFNGTCALEGSQNVTERGVPSVNSKKMQCSIPIVADEKAKGVVWATAPYITGNDATVKLWRFKKIIIVEKPKSAVLALSQTVTASEGTIVTATCSALESRYGADFIWTFGNETLTSWTGDNHNVSITNNTESWTWPWETKTIEQTISRRLGPEEDGESLKCTARFFNQDGTIGEILEGKTRTASKESSFWVWLILTLAFIILALAIIAWLIYARHSKKFCFRQKADSVELRQRPPLNRHVESERISENPAYGEWKSQPDHSTFVNQNAGLASGDAEYENLQRPEPEPQYEEIKLTAAWGKRA